MLSRRDILKAAGLGGIASLLPALTLAKVDTDARFVLVILRGAVDGLALAAPYGDGQYNHVRGELALPKPGEDGGLLKLDGLFGLHPALPGIFESYRNGEALFVHAITGPYRARSHFDGQDMLETGAARVGATHNGWLNRALQPLGGSLGNETAIALGQNAPLVLRGDNSVSSWAPSKLPGADDSTLARLQDLYSDDEFFSTRLAQALNSREIADSIGGMDGSRRQGNARQQTKTLMGAAARFLSAPDGPQIAVLEASGWDTHANQGAESGLLANRFAALDEGLVLLRTGLGPRWRNTIVAVVTEFGRTVHVNGTRGTDHGTATAALVLGGAIKGGRVIADWPGLGKSDLLDGRDLKPTRDLRSLFKGLLAEHLELPESFIEKTVFPDSRPAAAMRDLVRT